MQLAQAIGRLAESMPNALTLSTSLARLEQKVDGITSSCGMHLARNIRAEQDVRDLQSAVSDVQHRVSTIERISRWIIGPSLLALLLGIIGLLVWLLPKAQEAANAGR